ncbi:hypothetical protein RSAG8_04904, partial [Rhizoctonia solani AG-8 WAC10335]
MRNAPFTIAASIVCSLITSSHAPLSTERQSETQWRKRCFPSPCAPNHPSHLTRHFTLLIFFYSSDLEPQSLLCGTIMRTHSRTWSTDGCTTIQQRRVRTLVLEKCNVLLEPTITINSIRSGEDSTLFQ